MLPFPENTALILFTRTPQEEVLHKNLLGSRKIGQQKYFFQKLVQHARRLGRQSGLPFYVVDSTSQQGATFGERIYQAIAAFFTRGFAKVIVIGNDCAALRSEDIKQAAALLQNKAAVFGPAQDGGVYLLGIYKGLFTQNSGFSGINWQTASVLKELQVWCGDSENVILSPVYADLDSAADLRFAFNKKQLPAFLLAILTAIFSAIIYGSPTFCFFLLNQLKRSLSFRGPPLFR